MKQYVVDAFTDEVFHGNPAAICILEQWPSEELMMNITLENNYSETAFAVKEGDSYRLRWFTPGGEIDLCGHATLACAFVLLNYYLPGKESVTFQTLSGELTVKKHGDLFEMDFPAYELVSVPVTSEMIEAIGAAPREAYMGRDLLCVFDDAATIGSLDPDQAKVADLDGLLLHVTAKGTEVDCVSRSFAPKCNVEEDPVCGSGHCHIAPYWAKKLEKPDLIAYQDSARGGTLYCHVEGDRVKIAGKAALYSIAELQVGQDVQPCRPVVKEADAKKRTFKGVSLDSLAVGEKTMVCKMNYVVGNFATEHAHPHEQSGYVISGRYLMTVGDEEFELVAGDSYAIPGNMPHSFKVLEAGEVIDVFSPMREDYL